LRAWHALLDGIIVGIFVVFIETLVGILVAFIETLAELVEIVVALVVPTGTFVELGVVALNVILDVDGALDVRLKEELGDALDDCEGAGVTWDDIDCDGVGCGDVELTTSWISKSVICHVKAGMT
jgi:hypothetical protein